MPENEKLPSPVNLKHRLIGAVILVLVAVMLVPLILSEQEPPAELKTVSETPDKSATPVSAPAPVASEYTLPEPPSEPVPVPEHKPVTVPTAKAPTDDSKDGESRATTRAVAGTTTLSKGWVVQVGIFANAGNATRLSERLKQQGHAVLLDSISQNNEKRTRLRVGPFADKDAAQQAREKIQQQAGVAGAIVTYP